MKKFFVLSLLILLAQIASAQDTWPIIRPNDARHRVHKIYVDALDVFDPKLPQYRSWPFRFLNSVHIKTNDSFIRRELLFREGDYYDDDLLRESERNLRKHHFLDNIRIERVAVGANEDDIYVHTEDQWTTQFDVSAKSTAGYTKINVSGEESNLLGYGKTVSVQYQDDPERTTYGALYYDPQFFNTRWNFETSYEKASDGWEQTTDLLKPFYSLDTKWAYGLAWDARNYTDPLYDKSRAVAEIDVNHRVGVGFMARAWGERYNKRKFGVLFSLDNVLYPNPARILYGDAATVKEIKKQLNPFDKESYQYGGLFAWDRQTYIEERYMDNFGRIEDLPDGFYMANLVAYADSAKLVPDYYALHSLAQYSHSINDHQYFSMRGDFSLQRQNSGVVNNIIFSGYTHYYLQFDELKVGKFIFPRQTLAANLSATLTKDVDAPFQISLGEDEGLRGYKFKSFNGENSILFNVENRIFTPLDFRIVAVGLAAFVDAGYSWYSDEALHFKDFGLSAGVGLRIGLKKSQSARVVRVDLAIPLHKETSAFTESNQKGYSISVSSDQIFRVVELLPKIFNLF
jgi:surface antigen Omp85-like protein/surface antigen-like variable number repeat protein